MLMVFSDCLYASVRQHMQVGSLHWVPQQQPRHRGPSDACTCGLRCSCRMKVLFG